MTDEVQSDAPQTPSLEDDSLLTTEQSNTPTELEAAVCDHELSTISPSLLPCEHTMDGKLTHSPEGFQAATPTETRPELEKPSLARVGTEPADKASSFSALEENLSQPNDDVDSSLCSAMKTILHISLEEAEQVRV